MKRTIRIVLQFWAFGFLVFSGLIFLDVITPDAYDPNERKPNLEEDLKPLKLIISGVLLLACWMMLLMKACFWEARKYGLISTLRSRKI